jgi:hypothetical protein
LGGVALSRANKQAGGWKKKQGGSIPEGRHDHGIEDPRELTCERVLVRLRGMPKIP